ncbi:unnamed protein product [marine sediment metagenome]|uniref:Type II toxin-antitoxin system HicA family toxin n=1 Tax=marine sediment metagenome TaxID=412755 RepID=X1FW70_9ZZZZ
MSPLPTIKIEKAFRQKGLTAKEASGHRKWMFLYKGKYTGIFTKVSRGPKYKMIDDSNLGKMSKQLKFLMLSDFKDFVECPITQEMYLDLLKEQNYI